jgi:hypothetical protein
MRIFKNKHFTKWAIKEGVDDNAIITTIGELERGLINANLGGNVFKQRVVINSRGKSGGVRTILAYKIKDKAFFIYGFAKNSRTNITDKELKALKLYAATLLGYSEIELDKAVKNGALIEVENNE